jgi:hypothetical protein
MDVKLQDEPDGGMPGSIVGWAFVECQRCGAKGPRFADWGNPHYKQDAVTAWNKIKF